MWLFFGERSKCFIASKLWLIRTVWYPSVHLIWKSTFFSKAACWRRGRSTLYHRKTSQSQSQMSTLLVGFLKDSFSIEMQCISNSASHMLQIPTSYRSGIQCKFCWNAKETGIKGRKEMMTISRMFECYESLSIVLLLHPVLQYELLALVWELFQRRQNSSWCFKFDTLTVIVPNLYLNFRLCFMVAVHAWISDIHPDAIQNFLVSSSPSTLQECQDNGSPSSVELYTNGHAMEKCHADISLGNQQNSSGGETMSAILNCS